jgi:hypothetical protein
MALGVTGIIRPSTVELKDIEIEINQIKEVIQTKENIIKHPDETSYQGSA